MTTKTTRRRLSPSELTALYPPNEDPLPDAMIQEPYITDSLYLARDYFRNRADVFIRSNTFIYYDEGNRRAHVAPDWYVSFGVAPEAIREVESYLLWIVGKPPEFVLEIASPATYRNDLGRKRDLYARLSGQEYWRYDPTGGELYGEPLVGEDLAGGAYRRLHMYRTSDGRTWGSSTVLGLDIYWGTQQVEFADTVSGEPLRRIAEERAEREAAESALQIERAARRELEAELRRLRQS